MPTALNFSEEFTQLCMTKLQPRIKQIKYLSSQSLYIKPYKQQK